jgi:hypothetical protein
MQLESVKAPVATVWVSAVCTAGIAGNLTSLSGWTVLAGLTALPPLAMMRPWNSPRQSMSESIQEALPHEHFASSPVSQLLMRQE